jgi:hypothetical protein
MRDQEKRRPRGKVFPITSFNDLSNAELDQIAMDQDGKAENGKAADRKWLSRCIRSNGKDKTPLPVLANALIGVRAVWPDAIAYDEMLCAPMLMLPLQGENDFSPRPLTDVDVGVMQEELQHRGLKRISKDVMHQAIDVRAHERRFHPVRDHLDSLRWDGTKRVEKLFSS